MFFFSIAISGSAGFRSIYKNQMHVLKTWGAAAAAGNEALTASSKLTSRCALTIYLSICGWLHFHKESLNMNTETKESNEKLNREILRI